MLINHTNTINKLILVPNHHQTTIVASPMIQFDQPIHPVAFIIFLSFIHIHEYANQIRFL